ncbi:MAG: hypothetical protein MUF72_14515 [Elainella sp. Prado103]|jgi:hypothetical protein|nr:hypothetical protein [Elainella sp. Prado103]
MPDHKPFSEIYVIDPTTQHYMIEIGLDQYSDIFSEWDPAPFKRREIDPDLATYLEESSQEIPGKHRIELCFILPLQNYNQRIETEARQGLANSFIFKLYLLRKQLKKTNAQMLRLVILGLLLLWFGAIATRRVEEGVISSTLIEGVFIAGWVFLWEAVSLFFFTNLELYQRYRTYRRLQDAPVIFRTIEKLE